MKFPTHGHLSVDEWRQRFTLTEDVKLPFTLMKTFDISKNASDTIESFQTSREIPAMVGFMTVAAVYAAVPFLVASDGPLPFGDALAVGLLLIPDPLLFGLGYYFADEVLDAIQFFNDRRIVIPSLETDWL